MAEVIVNPAMGMPGLSGTTGLQSLQQPLQHTQGQTQYRQPVEQSRPGIAEVLVQHLLSLPANKRREVLAIPIQQVQHVQPTHPSSASLPCDALRIAYALRTSGKGTHHHLLCTALVSRRCSQMWRHCPAAPAASSPAWSSHSLCPLTRWR
jgi:hypothetical protein